MKTYAVTPSVDADGWFVKVENVAPTALYTSKDAAIEKAEQTAKENSPSKLVIYDQHKTLKKNGPFKKSLRPSEGFSLFDETDVQHRLRHEIFLIQLPFFKGGEYFHHVLQCLFQYDKFVNCPQFCGFF